MSEFVLWHAKHGGWLTGSATYSSELSAAKKLPWSEALERCKRVYRLGDQGSEYGLLPVPLAALKAVAT